MPRYAVDFLAEIQEVTTATNLDDCSDSVDLLTTCPHFTQATEQPSVENNVVSALMGNGQCCFKRYPGYQSHRHVVVSRGVQCSEAILRKSLDIDKDDENKCLFNTTERGDNVINNRIGAANALNQANVDSFKTKSELSAHISDNPPELRESSKFIRKKYSMDLKKSRRYLDDDIDSLSATFSNYSLHEKLLGFDMNRLNKEKHHEQINKNNHKYNNPACVTPTPRQRQCSLKGSTDAIRGSTTKTFTHDSRPIHSNEIIENQSSDSCSSFGHCKDSRGGIISNSVDYSESTPIDTEKLQNCPQLNTSEILHKTNVINPIPYEDNVQQFITRLNQPQSLKAKILSSERKSSIENPEEEKPIKSNSDSKCSSTVTFLKGSEELLKAKTSVQEKTQKSLDLHNLHVLRLKQRFLMRHTRNNSKLTTITNNDCPPLIPQQEVFSQGPKQQQSLDNKLQPYRDSLTERPFIENSNFTPPNTELSRKYCTSRGSNHSERASMAHIRNTMKLKRTVSFDKNKPIDPSKKSLIDQRTTNADALNQICTRNKVRAKYCSTKVIKQRFYIPESANIEHILLDPSDRRIKAICDRHNCDIEIYSKVPKSGFLKNIIVLAAPNSDHLRKCVRSLDYSMCWCLTAQLP